MKARTGFRQPQSEQERRVLVPSWVPYKASKTNFEALTATKTTALQATTNEWTPGASDGGSKGKKSLTRRGSVGLAIGDHNGNTVWTGEELLQGEDQTAMPAEVAAAQRALQSKQKSKVKRKFSYWSRQLRRIITEGGGILPKPKAYIGLWNRHGKRQGKACLKPAGARPTGKGLNGSANSRWLLLLRGN